MVIEAEIVLREAEALVTAENQRPNVHRTFQQETQDDATLCLGHGVGRFSHQLGG